MRLLLNREWNLKGVLKEYTNRSFSCSESGPMMISPTGQIIIPSTCPGSILVDFITSNLEESKERARMYKDTKYVERDLLAKVLAKYRLKSLNKDDAITPANMIACLEQLLMEERVNFRQDQHLSITHYYSVLSDGTICIPWDWTY